MKNKIAKERTVPKLPQLFHSCPSRHLHSAESHSAENICHDICDLLAVCRRLRPQLDNSHPPPRSPPVKITHHFQPGQVLNVFGRLGGLLLLSLWSLIQICLNTDVMRFNSIWGMIIFNLKTVLKTLLRSSHCATT